MLEGVGGKDEQNDSHKEAERHKCFISLSLSASIVILNYFTSSSPFFGLFFTLEAVAGNQALRHFRWRLSFPSTALRIITQSCFTNPLLVSFAFWFWIATGI